jgi:hypothetical protein
LINYTAENLIEPAREWGLDNVWRLKLDSNSADKGYGAHKMYYDNDLFPVVKETICLSFTAGGFDTGFIRGVT